MYSLVKKMIAEFIGTFVLVFVACGVAACTGGSLVATSLAFGLVIVAMAYSIGNISGCHINPAVSLGCLLAKRMTLKEFGAYVLAQVLGAVVGGVLVFGLAKMGDLNLVGNACNAVYGDAKAGAYIGSILVEVILTFIFVYVILNVTAKPENGKIAGLVIGLTLTLVHLLGICFTGTSVNPARSVGTAIAAAIFNGETTPLAQVWLFIVAPLAGGALAAVVYKVLHKESNNAE